MRRFLSSYWPIIAVIASVAVLVAVILLCNWRIIVAAGVVLFFSGSIMSAIWIANQQKKAQGLSIGKESDSPVEWAENVPVRLSDFAGCDEVKEEVQTYINFLKDPDRYTRLGGRLPRGLIVIGEPGTGKTLLAKGIAGEANVPFAYTNGSNFVKIFVGQGPARVRQCFSELRKKAPCIFFLDEADALGKRGPSSLHQEYNNTISAFLVELDGLKSNEGILFIAATNDPLNIDPALLRAGRLDERVIVDMPDVKGRKEILEVHAKKIKLDTKANLQEIAKATPQLPGSELENIVNRAAIMASGRGAATVEQSDLLEAVYSTVYGPEKKNRKIVEEKRRRTAYHECGHALATIYKPGGMEIHKVTIVPRGLAGGANHCLPENEGMPETNEYLIARLVTFMGGRAAEELIFKNFSSGPKADLTNATDIAKKMVCEYGMTDAGLRTFGLSHNFLNMTTNESLPCSPKKQEEIDAMIDKLLNDAYKEALDIVTKHRIELEALTKAILEKENLTGEEVKAIVKSVSA